MMITLSPVSIFGVKVGLCFPLSNLAASVATLPSGLSVASIIYHFLSTSRGLAEYVLENGQKVYSVHLDHHGPNIFIRKETDANSLIRFVEKYFDMSKKTTGLNTDLV